MPDLTRDHPDYHEVRSHALGWLIDKGRIRQSDLDKALENGQATLRYERDRPRHPSELGDPERTPDE